MKFISQSPHHTAAKVSVEMQSTFRGIILGIILFLYTAFRLNEYYPAEIGPIQILLLLIMPAWWGWKLVRRERIARSPMVLPMIALLSATTLATIFSINIRVSYDGLLRSLLYTVAFLCVSDLLLAGWRAKTFITALLILTLLVLSQGILWIVRYYNGWYALGVPEYPVFPIPLRLYGVYDHPNYLAALINLALPFAIDKLAATRRSSLRALWVLWLLAATVVLFFTRSRGGTIATSVVVLLSLGWQLWAARITQRGRSWMRHTLPVWGTVCSCFVVFIVLGVVDTTFTQSDFSQNGGSISTGGGRFLFWTIAWQSFTAHPITGTGPLTYSQSYLQANVSTRFWVAPHAHNLYIDTLAQQGVIGLLAFGWLLLIGVRTLLRGIVRSVAIVDLQSDTQLILASTSVALTGYLVHSLVEVPSWPALSGLLIVILTAVGLHAAGAITADGRPLARWTGVVLIIPVFLVLPFVQHRTGFDAMLQALTSGARGEWHNAAEALDHATAVDPRFPVYAEERAYAYAVLSDPPRGKLYPDATSAALEHYATAFQLAQTTVPNLLNAAALWDQAGGSAQAQQLLLAAVPKSPDRALPALLLAESYVAAGRHLEAEELFVMAFRREPHAQEMIACKRSTMCQEVARRGPQQTTTIDEIRKEAHHLMADQRADLALAVLKRVSYGNRDPRIWLDRAAAHVKLGQLPQATYALRVARILRGEFPAIDALAARTAAELHISRGQRSEAIQSLEQLLLPTPVYRSSSVPFFRHHSLPGDLIPCLRMLERTEEDLDAYRQLAHLYAQEGRRGDERWAMEQVAKINIISRGLNSPSSITSCQQKDLKS